MSPVCEPITDIHTVSGTPAIQFTRTHDAQELLQWYRKPFILRGQFPDPKSVSVSQLVSGSGDIAVRGLSLIQELNEERFAHPADVHLRFTRGDRLLGFVSYRPICHGVVDGHVALIASRSATMNCLRSSFQYMKERGTEWIVAVVYPKNRAICKMADDLGFFPCNGVFEDSVEGRLHFALCLS